MIDRPKLDPLSKPLTPAFTDDGERLGVSNRDVREHDKIPRAERVLEIACGRSVVAVVFPRGVPSSEWRLQLLDEGQPLTPQAGGKWPRDTNLVDRYGGVSEVIPPNGDNGPYGRHAPFRCVCGRQHTLDRDAVMDTAVLLEPRSKTRPARRIDFSKVASTVRLGVT